MDGFQLCRIVHATEDDLRTVPECDLHGRAGELHDRIPVIVQKTQTLPNLLKQRKAGFAYRLIDLTDNQHLTLFCKTFQNDFDRYMIGL